MTSPTASSVRRPARTRQAGHAAAAAFLERAAHLTPEPGRRARRALAAAHAKFDAGSFAVAADLLTMAGAGSLDELDRARLGRLRAKLALAQRRGGDAPRLLLDAARRLEPLDVRLARDTYLEALEATIVTGRLGTIAARRRSRRPLAPRRRRQRRPQPTTCSTGWRRCSPTATRSPRRRCGERCGRPESGRHPLARARVPRRRRAVGRRTATLALATRHARLARDARRADMSTDRARPPGERAGPRRGVRAGRRPHRGRNHDVAGDSARAWLLHLAGTRGVAAVPRRRPPS